LPEIVRQIREAAIEHGTDPFTLGALVYRQSRCLPQTKSAGGVGLLQIQPGMFSAKAQLPFPRADLAKEKLTDPAHNLRVGIALLKMWQEEHPTLDRRFASTPHRTAISHFVWGDRVWGATAEDRVLTARRRLIEMFSAPSLAVAQMDGVNIVSPLDGGIRLGTSGPGADRENGHREHRGIDVDATVGEPVRVVADGVVRFAGADMPGRQPARWLTSKQVKKWRNRHLGPGGIFVRVEHQSGLRTGYFHLNSVSVTPGQIVRAGEVLGTVGRSGVKVSNSHLHFEVQTNLVYGDPVRFLSPFVLSPALTLTHERAMAEKQERLDREKRHARRARRAARKARLVSQADVSLMAPPTVEAGSPTRKSIEYTRAVRG
jgi:murein DD-endopeptidase MepM/ murein hydrolase activator NlpD